MYELWKMIGVRFGFIRKYVKERDIHLEKVKKDLERAFDRLSDKSKEELRNAEKMENN